MRKDVFLANAKMAKVARKIHRLERKSLSQQEQIEE